LLEKSPVKLVIDQSTGCRDEKAKIVLTPAHIKERRKLEYKARDAIFSLITGS